MTKVELVNRIRDITGKRDLATKATLLDCVDGFAETLLLRVRNQAEMALQEGITEVILELRAQGRGSGK